MGYRLKSSILVSEITSALGLIFRGEDVNVQGVSTLDDQFDGHLVFSKLPANVSANSIVVESGDNEFSGTYTSIISDNPRLDFIRILNLLVDHIGFSTFDFVSTVDESAVIGANVVIENDCVIKENVIIEPNCVIHSGTTIGANTRIRSCSSVGGDGFGFERLSDGTPIRFPHLGGVIIGQNVEIGALNSIARGSLSNTRVDDLTKTDNLVHIAHNCHVKRAAFLTACVELSGGGEIGQEAWVGPNASVIQKVVIGKGSLVGIGAVVTKNVKDNSVWFGNPAKKLRDLN